MNGELGLGKDLHAIEDVAENITNSWTGYGIFKSIMAAMEWAKAFTGALTQTVASFKTNGARMAEAVKNIGAAGS